jgi:hypothetical protein
MSATSTLDPNVSAYLGGRNTVNVSGEVQVIALLRHAEGHSFASAYGGGAAEIGASGATSTIEPKVTAYAGSGSNIRAGTNIVIQAENLSEPTGEPLTDNFEAGPGGVNGSTGEITFKESGLVTGNSVLYVSDGNLLPGMRQDCRTPFGELYADGGCIYNVIVVNGNHIKFGNEFATTKVDTSEIPGYCSSEHPASCAGVDTARNVIRFATEDNFATGDEVILEGAALREQSGSRTVG